MGDTVGKLEITVPCAVISTSASSIIVTATTQGIEHELIFPATQATATIVESVSREIGVPFKEPFRKQIAEKVEITKTYVREIEISLNLENGFKFSFKRSPKKIIKSFMEEQK